MTERMRDILRVLAEEDIAFVSGERRGNGALTPNQIGRALGFDHGMHGDRYSHTGKRMGPANRVNFAITRLAQLGLVGYASRADGMSGGAYRITEEGKKERWRIAR